MPLKELNFDDLFTRLLQSLALHIYPTFYFVKNDRDFSVIASQVSTHSNASIYIQIMYSSQQHLSLIKYLFKKKNYKFNSAHKL